MVALWLQPAGAVTVAQLTGSGAGVVNHQKITLSGLTGADTLKVSGYSGGFNMYDWYFIGGSWLLSGNTYPGPECNAAAGKCHEELALSSPTYGFSLSAMLDITVTGSEIFVDWSKAASGFLCDTIAEANRVNNEKCAYAWQNPNAVQIVLDVAGPSAKTFGYSIENVPAPVPEPATWALMIVGIGMAGAALRRGHVMVFPALARQPVDPSTLNSTVSAPAATGV